MEKDDPGAKVARLRNWLDVRWSEGRTLRVQRRLMQRRRQLLIGRLVGVAVLGLIGTFLAVRHGGGTDPSTSITRPTNPGRELRLSDRSLVSAIGGDTELRLREDGQQKTVVQLERGQARFEVTRRPGRLFRVEAGGVSVEVLGTIFSVSRGAAEISVSVERGQVRVRWDAQERLLWAGQRGSFPTADVNAAPASASAPPPASRLAAIAAAPAPSNRGPLSAAPVASSSCREAGKKTSSHPPSSALKSSASERGEPPAAPAARLLKAADAARLGPNPEAAVAPLQELLRDHRADQRAPLAAFALGKLQLDELDRPEEAARSFALAQVLDPDGPLQEDALAREVEAWERAGQHRIARERATEYLRRYPKGSRLLSVQRHGHLR